MHHSMIKEKSPLSTGNSTQSQDTKAGVPQKTKYSPLEYMENYGLLTRLVLHYSLYKGAVHKPFFKNKQTKIT